MRLNGRKVIGWLIVAFALFYLATRPTEAAATVRGAAGLLEQGFNAALTFFSNLA